MNPGLRLQVLNNIEWRKAIIFQDEIRPPLENKYGSVVDFIRDMLDRFVDYFRVFGSHRSLKNACFSNILVNSSLGIFRLFKGILLELEFDVLVK